MAGISARSLQIRHPRRGARLRGGGRARQANGPRRARTSNFENARRKASAGVHFSFGIGLPFFGAVVAPPPVVVVPAPAYLPPPAYYPYPYPPVVAYAPPGYYGGSVVVWGRHYRGRHRW